MHMKYRECQNVYYICGKLMAMTRFLDAGHMDRTFRKIADIRYESIASAYSETKVKPYYV